MSIQTVQAAAMVRSLLESTPGQYHEPCRANGLEN